MKPGTLIHYGCTKFDPNLFMPIKNHYWNKPSGGFWTSPINSHYGWRDWNEHSEFRKCTIENSCTIVLKPSVRIYIIDSIKDLIRYSTVKCKWSGALYLDFERMSKKYDAIWVTTKGLMETSDIGYVYSLYGWDCETVLILNKKVIII